MKKYLLFLIGLFLLLPVMAQTDEGSDDAEIVEASDESLSDIDNKVVLHRYKMGHSSRKPPNRSFCYHSFPVYSLTRYFLHKYVAE